MILGVETSFRSSHNFSSANNAPGAAMTHAWRGHGVLAIEASCLAREQLLAVAKYDAISVVSKGAASQNALVDILTLAGQLAQTNGLSSGLRGCFGLSEGRRLSGPAS